MIYDNKISDDELGLLKSIFHNTEHYITLNDRGSDYAYRFKYSHDFQLLRRINKQMVNSDFYITKYPINRVIDTIILDFDHSKRSVAYQDVKHAMKHLKKNGLSCMVVDSTNKGFHLYIRFQPYSFNNNTILLDFIKDKPELDVISLDNPARMRDLFVYFQKNLIGYYDYDYKSLDEQNLNAGLGGIIRVPFSIHPGTNKRCEVKINNLKTLQLPTKFQWKSYIIANEMVKEDLFKEALQIRKYEKGKVDGTKDIVKDNDLRTIFPSIFGGDVRKYSDYIYMQCPFHNDKHPSCCVKKEYFYCTSCNTMGNIWYLIKNGYLEYYEA